MLLREWRARTNTVCVAFLLLQGLVIALELNGPFLDEGVNAIIGRRLWQGTGDDHSWLGGSAFLFPAFGGLGYSLAGLRGLRFFTALLYTLSLLVFAGAARRWFGKPAALWATILLATNGIWFGIAHLAVYDALALLALAAVFRSLVELTRHPSWPWLLVVAISTALCVLAKYPTVIALVPMYLCATLTVPPRRVLWIAVGAVLAAALSAAYMLTAYGFIVPRQALTAALTEPAPFQRSTLVHQALYALGLPLLLALPGVLRLSQKRKGLALTLFFGALLWPAIHIAMNRYVSIFKHSAFGFMFLYPLVGVSMARLWETRRGLTRVLLAGSVMWGGVQWYAHDHSWRDIRPTAEYLLPKLSPSDRIAADPGWDVGMYAILENRLDSPWAITDRSRVLRGDDPCDANWIIGARRGNGGVSDPMVEAAIRCGFEVAGVFPASFLAVVPPLFAHLEWDFVLFKRPDLSASASGSSNRRASAE